MEELFKKLDHKDWLITANTLHKLLKSKLQTPKGLIKSVRDLFDEERRKSLNKLREDFLINKDISNLDNRINEYTSQINLINSLPQSRINYELLDILFREKTLHKLHPECMEIVNFLKNDENSLVSKLRLNSVVTRIVIESSGASNKSNAGLAGEEFVKVIFDLVGLKENVHYKAQHKSKKGSDTDYVFPYVEDFIDLDVDIFMAVQFSSNDRARLGSSELKDGAKKYFVTGNGLDASTKNLRDIGVQIIEDHKSKNIQMVCFSSEKEKEIKYLRNKIVSITPSNISDVKNKLEYIENYTISFSELAKKLISRLN